MRTTITTLLLAFVLTISAQTTKIYDETIDPLEQIDAAVAKAKEEGKFVVAQVGGNWCKWCLMFAKFITEDPEIKKIVDDNFVYIHVNYPRKDAAAELMKRLNNAGRFGYPAIVVLRQDGSVMHIQDSSFLEEGEGYNKEKVMRFFQCWTPEAVGEKKYQARVQATIESENPDNLYTRICEVLSKRKVMDGKCVVTPFEEGVCVNELTDIYLKEKDLGDKEGFTPVILQLDINLIENIEQNIDANLPMDVSFDNILAQAQADLKDVFANGEPGEWEKFIGTDDGTEGECLDGIDGVDFMWGRFVMVRVPVTNPYDVFTCIPFGNWNDCPNASIHRAFAKQWHEQHGAVPCVITSDIIMYYVSQPVGKSHAFNLAMEHAAYCPDTPMQITFSVWDLAKQLERSTFWFCWWD